MKESFCGCANLPKAPYQRILQTWSLKQSENHYWNSQAGCNSFSITGYPVKPFDAFYNKQGIKGWSAAKILPFYTKVLTTGFQFAPNAREGLSASKRIVFTDEVRFVWLINCVDTKRQEIWSISWQAIKDFPRNFFQWQSWCSNMIESIWATSERRLASKHVTFNNLEEVARMTWYSLTFKTFLK